MNRAAGDPTERPRDPGTSPVLVTGALGLVGTATLSALTAAGHSVVATDLDTPANRKKAARLGHLPMSMRWADLTVPDQVAALVDEVEPGVIVHLAAMIPPGCYKNRALAREINVGAVVSLVRAATGLSDPPRFVFASSVAVYGPRNPHRSDELLTANTPLAPGDLYGAHKAEAERCVRESSLEWVVLRLGGVLTVAQGQDVHPDAIFFEASLPADGRIQTVDVRDVASAMTAAVSTPAAREVFLIGGDSTHRIRQYQVTTSVTDALGLVDCVPPGRPGDPDDDTRWFATDWMDTERSQDLLWFQRNSLPGMLREIRAAAGWKRPFAGIAAPLVRRLLTYRSPYRGRPGKYADPWTVIQDRLGEPGPDTGASHDGIGTVADPPARS
ncbi:NAD-dependent epimerase/dehydratase family protein [Nocardia sp. alder85J]|uniref:NAD-dependent epimerase/dehydratase family protein n=1 Tax=Nocardia sp. alder85J TaxID=2862949 RepID=UPI001CD293C9|nr:NAD(P)-dependent oxidoreductase [Nocardia sp. alder85J]MCX4095777.1 NAD(P)-dependent oxidoreductase [Nocardia sp. alder85J]